MRIISWTTLGVMFALLLWWQTAGSVLAHPDNATQAELLTIAKAAVHSLNQILVSGNVQETLEQNADSSAYATAMQSHFINMLNQHDALEQKRIYYTNFSTELHVSRLKIQGKKATLQAIEETIMHLQVGNGDPLAPKTTEYKLEHTFVFGKEGKKWRLMEDRIFEGFTPSTTSGNLSPGLPLQETAGNAIEQTHVPANPSATLNRSAIVQYAYTYAHNYNPNYRNFNNTGTQGGDCTNFASQALRNGGWTNVSGFYKNTSAWWYNDLNQSWTWINSGYWWQFAKNRPRAGQATYASQLQPGDILQADFNRDNTMDHTMIVTKKDSGGELYLTYHTTDTVDKPFSQLKSAYPNAWWYGWILHSNFN